MDYKEKYEQALAKAKEQYNYPCMRSCMGILEEIFPELAESEDEKVRKALLEMVHDTTGDSLWIDYNVHKEDAIAWLENIPYTIDHEKREGFHLGYKAGFEKQGKQKPTDEEMKTLLRTEYEKGRADAIAEMQKEWSEEDEKYVKDLADYFTGGLSLKHTEEDIADWLKSLRPQNRQKPSDEQIGCLSDAIEHYNSLGYPASKLKELLNDLKKLKD